MVSISSMRVQWRTPIFYLKVSVQYALIGMIIYQAHLALRDSDRTTFENRVRESIDFVENNHPGYRMYMIEMLGIDRVNCTRAQVPNLRDMSA